MNALENGLNQKFTKFSESSEKPEKISGTYQSKMLKLLLWILLTLTGRTERSANSKKLEMTWKTGALKTKKFVFSKKIWREEFSKTLFHLQETSSISTNFHSLMTPATLMPKSLLSGERLLKILEKLLLKSVDSTTNGTKKLRESTSVRMFSKKQLGNSKKLLILILIKNLRWHSQPFILNWTLWQMTSSTLFHNLQLLRKWCHKWSKVSNSHHGDTPFHKFHHLPKLLISNSDQSIWWKWCHKWAWWTLTCLTFRTWDSSENWFDSLQILKNYMMKN